MISCFKAQTSNVSENEISNHTALYTSTFHFNQEEVPKISTIIESLKKYDVFKYSAYRTAFKLHTIRKASKFHRIDLSIISSIFKEYECGSNSMDETITPAKAHNLICALYTEAGKKCGFSDEPNRMALLFVAFLQNAFVENGNPLLFIHMKIAITLFSAATLSEKFKYLFYYCSNGNTISKENLHILLNCLAKMTELVGEQVTFGAHLVPDAVKHLVKFSKGKVTLKKFRKWILLEPQTLVWISTLHRIAASENTQHPVSCDYCLVNPVVGFRYRCAQCINYNLCQNCFLHGCLNKRHKEKHPVQEFCHVASAWEETKAVINAMKNNFPFARCPSKAYLSFDEESLIDSSEYSIVTKEAPGLGDYDNIPGCLAERLPEIKNILPIYIVKNVSKDQTTNNPSLNSSMKKSTVTYIIKELSVIIDKLEEEKRTSVTTGKLGKENQPNNSQLLDHKRKENGQTSDIVNKNSNLDVVLGRLKELLQCLETPGSEKDNQELLSPVPHVPFNKMGHYFESTPLNSAMPQSDCKSSTSQLSSNINFSQDTTEKQRHYSTSLDFTNVLSSCNSDHLFYNEEQKSSPFRSHSTEPNSVSLDMQTFISNDSSLNLTKNIPSLDDSKLSPLYLSTSSFMQSVNLKLDDCNYSVTPVRKSLSSPSITKASSTFTLHKNKSLEEMEFELQAMLQHIEELLPQVSALSTNAPEEREKVVSALTDMECSVKKLSHISITLSTGSTDL